MPHEKPVLSAKDMAAFVASSPYKDYRVRCIEHFKQIHGDEYADAVKNEVIKIFSKSKRKDKHE